MTIIPETNARQRWNSVALQIDQMIVEENNLNLRVWRNAIELADHAGKIFRQAVAQMEAREERLLSLRNAAHAAPWSQEIASELAEVEAEIEAARFKSAPLMEV